MTSSGVLSPRTSWKAVVGMTVVVEFLVLAKVAIEIATFASISPPFGLPTAPVLDYARPVLQSSLHWLLGAPMIVYLGARFRPRFHSWLQVTMVHLAVAATLIYTGAVVDDAIGPIVFGTPPETLFSVPMAEGFVASEVAPSEWLSKMDGAPLTLEGGQSFAELVDTTAHTGKLPVVLQQVPVYLVLMLAVQALLAFGELKSKKIGEAQLRAELSSAQLAVLRMQVKPHFLFNTLNSVNALMGTDVTRARQMLADLSTLLRHSFRDDGGTEVSLAEELELVEMYIEIQRIRFGERLSLVVDVPREARSARIPALALQPLVENSIVHAVEKCSRACKIHIRAWRDGAQLFIEVVDDGPGETPGTVPGIGLQNTKGRLAQLYGASGKLEAKSGSAGGFSVTLTVPYHETSSTDPSRG